MENFDDLDNIENKVKFIVSIFKHYQPNLTTNEQLNLLNMWVNSCVDHEEYEMAGALKEEIFKIKENPSKVPQKKPAETNFSDIKQDPIEVIDDNKPFIKKQKRKLPIFKKIVIFFKKLFRKNKR
jgi:hypothetical protein